MVSLTTANNYFDSRLWTDEWDNASDEKKRTALEHAKRDIDDLKFSTHLTTEDYNRAVLEQTIFLLNLGQEDLQRLKLQAQGVKSVNVSKAVSESYVLNGSAYAPFIRDLQSKYKYRIGDLI